MGLALSLYPTGGGRGALSGSIGACLGALQRPWIYGFGSETQPNVVLYVVLAVSWT